MDNARNLVSADIAATAPDATEATRRRNVFNHAFGEIERAPAGWRLEMLERNRANFGTDNTAYNLLANAIRLEATRSGIPEIRFNAAERNLTAPHDQHLRETVWRALNPTATGPMPEDYEIPEGADPAQGLRAKAEGFIRSRQEALRTRSIAAILGNIEHGVKGRKKGFLRTQREQMLHDLEGIISPSDYQTLDTALKRETDPTYEPPVPTGGTFGVRGRVGRVANEAAYQANMARLATVEQDGQNTYSGATRDFYAEIGRARFEQELAVELAGPPPVTDAAQRAEIEKELRREVGVKVILQSMRGTDQDFEKMKQEQFLDRMEKTRSERMKGWYMGMRQKYPKSSMAATIALSAGAGTAATVFLFPAIFGYATAATVSGVFATRAATGVAFGQFSHFTAPLMDKWRGRRYRKSRRGEEWTGSEAADRAIQEMTGVVSYDNLAANMQRVSQEVQQKQNTLTEQEQSFLRRAGWAAIPTVAAGILLGVGTRLAAAETMTVGSPGKVSTGDQYMGFGKPTDTEQSLYPRTAPTAPVPPSSASPETPAPNPLDTSPPSPPPRPGPTGAGAPAAPAGPTRHGAGSTLGSEAQPPAGSVTPSAPYQVGQGIGWALTHPIDAMGRAWDFTKHTWDALNTPYKPKIHIPDDSHLQGASRGIGGGHDLPTTHPGAASHERLLAIGRRGPEGALIDAHVPAGDAHRAWLSYVADIKAHPDQHQDLFTRMRVAGYSNDQIVGALKGNGTQKLETLLGQAARRMKGGNVLYDPQRGKMQLVDEEFLKPRPARPRVSRQPTPQPEPQPSTVKPIEETISKGIREGQRDYLAQQLRDDAIANAQREVLKQNLGATGLDSARWGKDFWNTDFRAKNMTVDQFAKRTEQLADEMQRYPNRIHDYGDITGGGATQYDMEQLNKVAQQLKKSVPSGQQATTTVEQAFQRNSLGNTPPAVARPRGAVPQAARSGTAAPPSQPPQNQILSGDDPRNQIK